ncbi:hypothetical protein BANRA_02129 [Escherichia coli]|nr:DUF4060 family protein [Escherichia coli]VCV96807.1 hypothetical protein BANRA_02129 [Escherichia coli]
MKLINRGNQQSPIARQACDIALATHHERYGDYGRNKMKETYTVRVEGVKVGWSSEPQGELRGHGDDRHAPSPLCPGRLVEKDFEWPERATGESYG